jgi:hypothetical protein
VADPRNELGLLCEQFPSLRRLAEEHGLADKLGGLVEAAKRGEDTQQRRVDLYRRLGIDEGPGSRVARLPPVPDAASARIIYVCPAGQCARTWVRPPGTPIARCPIYRDRELASREIFPRA